MGRIRIVTPDERRQSTGSGGTGAADGLLLTEGEHGAYKYTYFPVDGEGLELKEVHLPPAAVVRPHAHTHDEIILVTEGSLTLGARELPSGAALFVGKETLYGFTAGPDGCVFLNFRPNPHVGYIAKEDFVKRRTTT